MSYDFTFSHAPEGFENHIEWSIRGYLDLISDVVELSRYFVERNSSVVDLGCSTGSMLCSIINSTVDIENVTYTGIELSKSFTEDVKNNIDKFKCVEKFKYVNDDITNVDLGCNNSLVTSIFTLQFLSRKDKFNVIDRVYKSLLPNGAFIFSEKIISEDPTIQDALTFIFYDYKKNKFSSDEILDKEKTLRSMLRLNTIREIEKTLHDVGFSRVDMFWRNHNFCGFIAIK